MPPKDKGKKGAVSGNYKAGKPLKDIMPAGSKVPREGVVPKAEGEPEIERKFDYEPLAPFPEWPGNEEAKNYDFTTGCEKDEEGETIPFQDNTEIFLPPSFKEFMRDKSNWLRPDEYLREILAEQEMSRLKAERKKQQRTRKNIRKNNLLNMGAEDMTREEEQLLSKNIELKVDKAAIAINPLVISHLERLETDAEINNRKAEEEKKAQDSKQTKKKAPAKAGKEAAADPSDEPQLIRVPIENSLDLGFSMPAYTKWVTSQLQLAKDRYIRDTDSNELVWQRIYPQENGMPIISPSGKYWVKVRFMGKERLIEIDDRIPCDFRRMPILPRTSNIMELWPQLIMKALLKVYSYKWYQPDAYFDQEIGDGSIIYSLTGLIPEHIPIADFERDAMPLFRNMLTDEWYFGRKAYLTAFCQEDFRPKLPTQLEKNKQLEVAPQQDDDLLSEFSQATSQRMLGKLKHAASMAISVTTGKKLSIKKNANASNIIPGFGYAIMDIFENDFVDMDSIVRAKDCIEEVKSPFKSPRKSMSPGKQQINQDSITKEEMRRNRREERKQMLEELERRERQAPTQHSLLQIKTAITRYPTINYIQPFTNEEIMEGKKCLLNHMRRTEEAEKMRQTRIEISSAKKGRRVTSKNRFQLNVKETMAAAATDQKDTLNESKSKSGLDVANAAGDEVNSQEDQKQEELKPRQRAMGGVWIESQDFPHAFQHIIVYHNLNHYDNREVYDDVWNDGSQPFTSNEKDVYLKLELDDEAFAKYKEDNGLDSEITIEDLQSEKEVEICEGEGCLPGERKRKLWGPDQILLSYTPNPTTCPSVTMPRYFMRFASDEIPGDACHIDETFSRYHEGKNLRLQPEQSMQRTIWLKPNMMAPQGYTLWVGSSLRKIQIVSQQEYLTAQESFVSKQYIADFLPLQKGKNHLFGKWDFKVSSPDTKINMRVTFPSDKYLQDYVRVKFLNKSESLHQASAGMVVHSCYFENLQLPVSEDGYIMLIEGCMPYNTTEGQVQIDVNTNQENLEFNEIVGCEPVEYSDSYQPSKYGIILKEKVFISPTDATMSSINIRLQKDGKDLTEHGIQRRFALQILDNGEVIYSKQGENQINLSHFLFRCNQGLPDGPSDEEGKEVKHNYVVQAVFLLHLWPECKTVNAQTEGLTWMVKMFNSETLALVKDTDKEDREKALKASWETADPGRAEKAQKSRQRYLLLKKQKAGEELTEEELETLKERRERIRKKDLEEQQTAKGGKGKAPAKADPKKAAKGAAATDQKVTEEEDESKKRVLPEPSSHVNSSIVTFLKHFKSARLIEIPCSNQNDNGFKRTDEEKDGMKTKAQEVREEERATHEQQMAHAAEMVGKRDAFRQAVFEQVTKGRVDYKDQLGSRMDQRNGYRDLIANRLEKQKALTELLSAEKIDITALQTAIDQAVEAIVRDDIIQRANKQLEWLKYCKEVEQQLQQAVQDKVKENLLAVLEKIEKEGILIEPKQLNDAKNVLNKLK